jgi:hypothetical protein
MPKEPPKPRKLRKNWLTSAHSAPDIPSLPTNASGYRLHPYSPPAESRITGRGSNPTSPDPQISSPLAIDVSFCPPVPDTPSTLVGDDSLINFSPLDSPISISLCSRSTLFDNIPSPPPPPKRPSQPRKTKLSPEERLQSQLQLLDKHLRCICTDFGSVGAFLSYLFWSRSRKRDKDLRLEFHRNSITRFLQGRNKIRALDIVKRIYNHRNSFPSYRARQHRNKTFSLDTEPSSIPYARVAISSWAAQLCATKAHRDISILTHTDPKHPEDAPARMSTSTVTWEDINSFSPQRSVNTFRRRAPFVTSFIEYLALPRRSGMPVEHKNRPVEIVSE